MCGVRVPASPHLRDALTSGCLELVEAIEEGAKSAEIATIERDAEAGERGEFGFISFLGVGSTGGDEGLGAEDIVKIFVETDESASGDLSMDADEHDVSDIAIGVEVVVEVNHFTAGEFEIVGNFEEGEVFFGNETISEQVFAHIFLEGFPKIAAGGIDHDERDDIGLPCLHQSERFESFVHGAEPAREEGDGIGVFDEVEFAGEEIFEGEKFGIPADGFVGFLFEREFDVEGEAVFASCACLGGTHDSFPPAGDDHIASFLHKLAEAVGRFIGRGCGLGAGGSEDGDFFDTAIRGEDLVGVFDFAHDAFELFEVALIGAIGGKTDHHGDHLLK